MKNKKLDFNIFKILLEVTQQKILYTFKIIYLSNINNNNKVK